MEKSNGSAGAVPPVAMVIQTRLIRGIEDLRQPVKGADVAITQVEPGQLAGSITYGMLGNFSVSLGGFSKALRSHGIMSRDRHVIGMLLGREDAVTHWSFDMRAGDVIFDHLGGTHDGLYKGGARFATIAMGSAELTGFVPGEGAMADLEFWQRRTQVRPDAALGSVIPGRFAMILQRLEENAACLSPAGSEFWMRALVESFIGAIGGGVPRDGRIGPIQSARVVHGVDDFLRAHGAAPVHISQLCQALNVSRRTLHRAFHETLGVGPVTYLRRQRLSAVRTALLANATRTNTIAQVALNFGFDDAGRFAGYYRQLFGERPSQTARRAAGPAGD